MSNWFPDEVVRLEGEASLNTAEAGAIRTRTNILNKEVEGGLPAIAYRRFTGLVARQHVLVDAPEGIGGRTLVIAFVASFGERLFAKTTTRSRFTTGERVVADHFLGATGASTEPQGGVDGATSVGEDFQAREGLACQVVVAGKGLVYCSFGHIEGKI